VSAQNDEDIDATCNTLQMEAESACFIVNDVESDSDTALFESQHFDQLYLRNLCLFFLKLECQHLIPSSTVQDIKDEMLGTYKLGLSALSHKLMNSLCNDHSMSPEDAKKVISDIQRNDSCILTSSFDTALRTNHVRKQTYKEMFNYVEPAQILLGNNDAGKEKFAFYIPILESLRALFKNGSVIQEYEMAKQSEMNISQLDTENSRCLYDIQCGYSFKENDLFSSNSGALRLILYQDAFEVCNPLGSAKKVHKMLAVYATLGNFRPHVRYNSKHIILVLLCKEQDFKFFGQEIVFRDLINDVKTLECDGIDLFNNGQAVKGTISFIAGDNLGSHCIGGFAENFSTVQHFCRYCLLTLNEFHDNPSSMGEFRTEDNYNEALREIGDAENQTNLMVHGIKFYSCFNSLSYYHVCSSGLPPCLGHDLFEGVINYDVALCLQRLVRLKWFSYETLNRKIRQFPYTSSDRNDQPAEVHVGGEKLGGHAVQNWCLLRLLPIILCDKIVDPDDYAWQLILSLRDITELVCAPKISEANIAYLNVLIQGYLHERKSRFPHKNLKPKHHFLAHYPHLILQYGPLIHVWTMRFESKHSYFKRCLSRLGNFKNPCQTVTERHQLDQAYRCAGQYFPNETDIRKSVPCYVDAYGELIQAAMSTHNFSPDDHISYDVIHRGTSYKKGQFVIIEQRDLNLVFGEIVFSVLRGDDLFFLLRVHQAEFDFTLHLFEILLNDQDQYLCVKQNTLLDYCPLQTYARNGSRFIALKHGVVEHS
jgi:hypothetical protein